MPHPAFEKLKQTVTSVVRVGESTARTAAPVVRRTTGDLVARLRRPDAAPPPSPDASSATPSPAAPSPAPRPAATATPAKAAEPEADRLEADGPESGTPSPASIAKNVPHQRPVAKAAPAKKKRTPSDSPGGKLPPRR